MPVTADGRDRSSNPPRALRAANVSKVFRSRSGASVHALSKVDLVIPEGGFVALLGPSGCGKTTMLRLLSGLERPTQGTVELFAEPVIGPSEHASMVFQGSVLLPWKTILNNVMLPAKIRHLSKDEYLPRARQLLARTGLSEFEDHYPRELSGGMRQRAAICRALLLDPPVMFMDEPFGALDAITRARLNEDLLDLWRETQKTVVFVTHDINEAARLASTVIVMSSRPGRISARVDLGFGTLGYEERVSSKEYVEIVAELNRRVNPSRQGGPAHV